MRILAVSLGVFSLFACFTSAESLPANRITDWTAGVRTGVPGGIPTNRTNLIDVSSTPFNADKTGVTSARAAIQAAIDSTKPGDVVYIPAGTYRIDGQINLSYSQDNITIRGAGPDKTVLTGSTPVFAFGASDGWNWPNPGVAVTAGLAKDSTSITLADATHFPVGALIHLGFEDQKSDDAIRSGAVPIFGVGGWGPNQTLRRQVTRVVGKSGNTLTIFPGIYHSPEAGLGARATVAQLQHDFVGLEDFAIDLRESSAAFPIMIQHAFGCWVKNVKITDVSNYGIAVFDSLQCDVRHCDVRNRKTLGTNGSALLVNTSSGCLFEDNIFYDVFPSVEVNHGSSGNVFAYNLCENPPKNGAVYMAIDTNHGPHNSFNLYEGNVAPNLMADGYFGGCSEDTVYRNWLHGTCFDGSAYTFTLSLKRFTRNYTLVGNVLGRSGVVAGGLSYGQPNIGNGMSSGTAKPSAGDFWDDWKATASLSTRTDDRSGKLSLNKGLIAPQQLVAIRWNNLSNGQGFSANNVSGTAVTWSSGSGDPLPPEGSTVEVFMQPGGYQEMDLDVEATTLDQGNYLYSTNGAPGNKTPIEGVPRESLFRTSKPTWFRSLAWPPFNPDSPDAASYNSIPAGYRFANNGAEPPSSPTDGQVPASPTNLRIK